MLDGLKRLFSRAQAPGLEWDELAEWARSREYAFKPVRGEDGGFIVEGRLGALPWRMEWGPSQRPYVPGAELRIRAEMGLPSDLQVLVLDRPLQATMEKAVFEQYVESVQTQIDNQTPPEMRWLVMYGKLAGAELGALRERFAAVTPAKAWLLAWLDGPLTPGLLAAPLTAGQPLVLMVARGRITLRTALPEPLPQDLDRWLRLFHLALREAHRVADHGADPGHASTQPSLFPATRQPGEPEA
ncbi:MAG: hypothetical protein Fur0014_12460 [Rubrivivax sp.]